MTAGPDGALWFTEIFWQQDRAYHHRRRQYPNSPIPTPDSQPYSIAAGPDGNVWFVEFAGNKIGRITPSGTITEFDIPTADSQPIDIGAGPDNAMWFAGWRTGDIGRITLGWHCHRIPDSDPASIRSPRGITIRTGRQSLVDGRSPAGAQCGEHDCPHHAERNASPNSRCRPSTARWPAVFWPAPTARCGSPRKTATRSAASPPVGEITEFPLPTPNSLPRTFTARSRRRAMVHPASRPHRPHHDERCDYRIHRSDRERLALRHRHRTRRHHLVHRTGVQQDRQIDPGADSEGLDQGSARVFPAYSRHAPYSFSCRAKATSPSQTKPEEEVPTRIQALDQDGPASDRDAIDE